jgi:hypothetical protein
MTIRVRIFLGGLLGLAAMIPATAQADSITIYAVRSPHGLSWKSPRALLGSTVRNSLSFGKYTRRIGHVFVELKTDKGDTLTGMTNVSRSDETKALFKKGEGLGVLFNDFAGELEQAPKLSQELDARYQSGKLSFATFKISSQTGARLETYLKEFKDRGEDEHYYGGTDEARKGKGAGCSAFGVSFLELAGLLPEQLKTAWLEKVNIPKSLIGKKDAKVSPLKLVFSKQASRWASAGEPHQHLEIYEPQKMSDWMQAMHVAAKAGSVPGVRAVDRGNAHGIEIDATQVPTPTDPIWMTK